MQPDRWVEWLRGQRFSAWETFLSPYEGRGTVRRQPWQPPNEGQMTFQQEWLRKGAGLSPAPYLDPLPESPRAGLLGDRLIQNGRGVWRASNKLDSADFGNTLVYVAIGAFGVESNADLSRCIKVCGPQKRDIPISPPHYDLPGGFGYTKIEATRLVLYGCSYAVGDLRRAALFRDFPRQRQARVRGTGIVVTTVENADLRVSMIDFAPREPELSLACRVFVAQSQGRKPVGDLLIHHLPVNSRGSWDLARETGGASLMDREDRTGIRLFSPGFADPAGPDLLASQPEESWQRLDLPLALSPIPSGGSSAGWSVLIPRIAGGDPEEERATEAAHRLDPWHLLDATARSWSSWSAQVGVQSDRPLLDDLVDNLQCLLKTHEGGRGFHLGTTYQRHTHAWSRDNYLMQRGLLAAGRIEEAARNLEGFMECVKASGICCGYNVFSRASWIPRATGEVCAYLLLMVRDLALWSRRPDGPSGSWDLVRLCADTIRPNSLGMVGFDGDEIWFWELDPLLFGSDRGADLRSPEQLARFAVLDNCWLALCGLGYAERVAALRGASAEAEEWKAKRGRIAAAMEERLWDPERGTYSSFLYPDGTRYDRPFVNGMCTPGFFGARERRRGSFRAMAMLCGRSLVTAEGIVKGNADTSIYAGLSPAFHLHALGSVGAYDEGDPYLEALLRATPSSGGAWEYSMVDLPYTGTDKRRGGDSGVLLAALMDYVLGFRPTWTGFTARPHLPRLCGRIAVKGIRFGDSRLDFDLDQRGTRIALDGGALASVPAGSGLVYEEATRKAGVASLEQVRAEALE